jgi:hypothetical protein
MSDTVHWNFDGRLLRFLHQEKGTDMERSRHKGTTVFIVGTLLALGACGREPPEPVDPNTKAAVNFASQFALLCPNEGFTWEAFDTAAKALGATPDDGEPRRPHGVRDAEVVREQWVAFDHLGRRTTAWIGELGPGTRYVYGVAGVDHTSGLVCAVHDPGVTRQEALAMTRGWEGGTTTGAEKTGPNPEDFIVRARTWVNTTRGSPFYQDVEMYTYAEQDDDGAILIRHRYNYGDASPAS